jgi:hypothetical protein
MKNVARNVIMHNAECYLILYNITIIVVCHGKLYITLLVKIIPCNVVGVMLSPYGPKLNYSKSICAISLTDKTCEAYTLRNIEHQRKSLNKTRISNSFKQQDRPDTILQLRGHFAHFIRRTLTGTNFGEITLY